MIICSRVEPLTELDNFIVEAFTDQIADGHINTLSLIGEDQPYQRDFFVKSFSDSDSP